MKYLIALMIILFPVFAIAQTNTHIDSLVKKLLIDLEESWTMGVDSNSEAVDIRVYNSFKNLFDSNATVVDDFNAFYRYDPGTKSWNYKVDTVPKPFDLYAHNVALQVNKLRIDTLAVIDRHDMTIEIKRTVYADKKRQFVLPDIDTFLNTIISSRISSGALTFENEKEKSQDSSLIAANFKKNYHEMNDTIYQFVSTNDLLITLAYNNDTVKITKIENLTKNAVACINDRDLDAILGRDDKDQNNSKKPGDFTANGTPDSDLDGVPDSTDKCVNIYGASNQGCPASYFITKKQFDGFIGLQFNSAKINLPGLNQLGYLDQSGNDAMDVLESKKGVLKNPGMLPGVYAGANFIYYFGEKRKWSGISIGVTYSGFTAKYQLADPIVYTFKSSDGVNLYRRQITISSLKEAISYNVFNIPVMFNYRMPLGKKNNTVINLQVGPSLMLFSNISNYNTVIDFGGLYQVDTVRGNAITYYDHFDRGSTYNVFLTSDSINSRSSIPGANNVFEQLGSKTYDFANNKNYNGKQNLKRMTAAFNLDVDVQHKFSEGLTIKVGSHFVYAPLLERKEKYKPVDKTTDEFQSIYKSTAKSSYSAFGINVGFVFNF